jgi:superfamily I DNA/RNA helicase
LPDIKDLASSRTSRNPGEPVPRLNLSNLNARQREAVVHGDGPLLVLAGAGSGKTSTMAYRIAHLVAERSVPGEAVLGLSFTRKAAGELKERVKKLVGRAAGTKTAQALTITTFHSLCVRILRADGARLGYGRNFTILDPSDQTELIRGALKDIRVDDRKFDADRILFEIGQAKNRFLGAGADATQGLFDCRLPSDYALVAGAVFTRYQAGLRALDAMDFDDLLFNAVALLEQDAGTRARYAERFRYLLVDEYQDTNPAQFRLLRLLTERRQNLCVVGDDDQSIYGWRGADSAHILEFTKQFPGARVITLDQNYRSTSTILDAANAVIARNRHRHPKSLWSERGQGESIEQIVAEDDRGEAEIVAEEIMKRAGEGQARRPWRDFAILYRSNAQSRVFEEALRLQRIPYKLVGGMSFLDRKEIKDVLSYWRLILNPRDDASARRVVNWPARGIGRGALEALNAEAAAKGVPFYEALAEAARVAPRAAEGAARFRALVDELRRELEATPPAPVALAAWARRSLERIGAKAAIEADSPDDPALGIRRWESVEELAHALGQLEPGEVAEAATGMDVLRDYLTAMTVEAKEDERDKKDDETRDQVTMLTLHGAKGLEYPVVFLVGMEDGFLPHRRTIEEAADLGEERRLCYVGITRARDRLILTRAKNRLRYGKPVPRNPSRFLEEIPAGLVVTRDESHTPDLSTKEAQAAHETKVKDFLSQIRAQIGGGRP